MRITIISPADRETSGSLAVTGADGEVILGPLPIAVGRRPGVSGPDTESEAGRDSGRSMSPPSFYTIQALIPMLGASIEEVREFGRYGLIVLNPAKERSGEGAMDEGTMDEAESISIHGGDLSESGKLRSANGSIRLANRDQRELMKILTVRGHQDVECLWIESDEEGPLEIFEPLVPSPSAPFARFAKVAAVLAAAAPFAAQSVAYADCLPYDSGSAFSAVDFNYILDSEGGDQLIGFVPNSSAGVTIAGGLDLGFQTSQQMLAMGFAQSQVTAFAPYLATSASQPLIGQAARNALAQTPLTIVQSHASLIDHVVYSYNANSVAGLYNSAVTAAGALPGVTFSQLPVAWQTAIVDMYFAYPPFSSSPCFQQLASGQWTAAIASLRNFGAPTKIINDRAKANGDYLANKVTGLPT